MLGDLEDKKYDLFGEECFKISCSNIIQILCFHELLGRFLPIRVLEGDKGRS
jgi:hypothetical protein